MYEVRGCSTVRQEANVEHLSTKACKGLRGTVQARAAKWEGMARLWEVVGGHTVLTNFLERS